MHEDYFRVTSCQHSGSKYTIFTGIPIKADSYKINSGKYIVSIRCENQSLPIQPSVGQQWRVRGQRALEAVQAGDYELQQHLYNDPAEMECTLPETGEALIRFIATDKAFTGIGESKLAPSGKPSGATCTRCSKRTRKSTESVLETF